jgi:prevent-host-death family protein
MTDLIKPSLVSAQRRTCLSTKPRRWQLHEAKARFSELVRRAKQEGPQYVTVHGREVVVVVGVTEFRNLAGERTGQLLVDAMRQFPHRSRFIEPLRSRSRMPVRDVKL